MATENTVIRVFFIRHAEKAYANGKGPKDAPMHDPPAKKEAEADTLARAKSLIELYGNPNVCIVSPYRRTRETAKWMLSLVDEKVRPEPVVDVTIAEFLGNQRPYKDVDGIISIKPQVEPETAIYKNLPAIGETIPELLARCKEHLKLYHLNSFKTGKPGAGYTAWVITHGFTIEKLYQGLFDQAADAKLTFEKHRGPPWGKHGVPFLGGLLLEGVYGQGAKVTILPRHYTDELVEAAELELPEA